MEEWLTLLKRKNLTMVPPARCARYDITLPGYINTNVITFENMFQPSYPTEIQIWLVSGYLGHRMPRKRRCDTNWRDDNVRFSGNELWKWVPRQEFIIKPRREWGGGWWTQRQFIEISKKMDFHNYVNKEITLVRSNDTMMYARGKTSTIKHWLKVHLEVWTK